MAGSRSDSQQSSNSHISRYSFRIIEQAETSEKENKIFLGGGNSINGRIKDLKKLKENLDTAVQKYQAVDDRVANNFR